MASSGDVVKADAAELAALGKAAAAAGRQVEDVSRQAGSIIGGLDGRGWNLGAVQARWSRTGLVLYQLEVLAQALEPLRLLEVHATSAAPAYFRYAALLRRIIESITVADAG
jgi:hypothetical protein